MFYVFSLRDGKPYIRQGEGHEVFDVAKRAAENYCRVYTDERFVVVETKGEFWYDPSPKVFNNLADT